LWRRHRCRRRRGDLGAGHGSRSAAGRQVAHRQQPRLAADDASASTVSLTPSDTARFVLQAGARFPKRWVARALAFSASVSRSLGGAPVSRASISRRAAPATSATAQSNAAPLALDGLVKPLSLRTNCNEASWISASVAGGSKLNSVLMF